MLVASVHLSPAAGVAVALAAVAILTWYWWRLGTVAVPASRRKIRRASLALMAVAIMLLVRGLSFVDHSLQPREYIMTWTMALLLILIVMVLAALDAMNNLRLIQRQAHDQAVQSARELMEAIERRRIKDDSPSPPREKGTQA